MPNHFADFYNCVAMTGLMDTWFSSNFLTWNNRSDNRTSSKLDRVLVNSKWVGEFFFFDAEFIHPRLMSNHSYMVIKSPK